MQNEFLGMLFNVVRFPHIDGKECPITSGIVVLDFFKESQGMGTNEEIFFVRISTPQESEHKRQRLHGATSEALTAFITFSREERLPWITLKNITEYEPYALHYGLPFSPWLDELKQFMRKFEPWKGNDT